MIRTQLETARLRLRQFTHDDLQVMYTLNTDPDVIKYADTLPRDMEEVRQRLEQGPLADYKKYGYGRFAVELKETGEVIGFCGIKYLPEIDLPEVGYRYMKEYWGRGIGTEAAEVCVGFARDDLKIKKLIALIIPENIASIRVAEKLGMTKGPLIHIYGEDAMQYEMML
jgi:ribosomal-protein-alanine N-acetyltransferase